MESNAVAEDGADQPKRFRAVEYVRMAVRLNHTNQAPLDYYLLPRLDFGLPRISLADHNAVEIESYRFDTLDYFYGMAQRTRIRRAA